MKSLPRIALLLAVLALALLTPAPAQPPARKPLSGTWLFERGKGSHTITLREQAGVLSGIYKEPPGWGSIEHELSGLAAAGRVIFRFTYNRTDPVDHAVSAFEFVVDGKWDGADSLQGDFMTQLKRTSTDGQAVDIWNHQPFTARRAP